MKHKQKLAIAAHLAISWPLIGWGANISWTFNGSSTWTGASNWLGGVPVSGSDVFISQNDSTNRTITYNYNGPSIQFNSLTIQNSGSGSAVFSQSANTFNSINETIGLAGTGYLNLGGGTHNASGVFALGSLSTAKGIGTVSSGTLAVTGNVYIGYGGAGTINQNNTGIVNIGTTGSLNQFNFAFNVGSNGTYLLSGTGVLNAFSVEDIGLLGNGTFNQSGGIHNLGSATSIADLFIGDHPGSTGNYILSNGTLTVFGGETIGYHGNGTFSQNSGTHNLGSASAIGSLNLGYNTGGLGTYLLSGTGILTTYGTEAIGVVGAGTFNQSGGMNNIGSALSAGSLLLAQGIGAGTYLLSSGSLNVFGSETIGGLGTGLFNQTGGTHNFGSASATTGSIVFASNNTITATYKLSGPGVLNVFGTENLGNQGASTFTQTGGTHNLGSATISSTLNIGFNAAPGYYSLSDGTLNAPGSIIDVSNFSAGTLAVNDGTLIASSVRVGRQAFDNGTLTMSGGTLAVQSESVGYLGFGTFIHSNGSNRVGTMASPGELDIGAFYSGAKGTYALSGTGTLNVVGSEYIGYSGSGSFLQSGGTHGLGSGTNSNLMYVGYGTTSFGNYVLNGNGTLNVVGEEDVGYYGAGTISQSDGTHNLGTAANRGYLFLATNPSATGTYSLGSAGTFNAYGTEYIGYSGTGNFTQTGGIHNIGTSLSTGTLIVGGGSGNPSAIGTYSLSSGTLSVMGSEAIGNGTFIQSGGTHNVGTNSLLSSLLIYSPNTSALYALNGNGTLNVLGLEVLSLFGRGALMQSAGTHNLGSATASSDMYMSYSLGSFGTYAMSGNSTLNVSGNIYVGGNNLSKGGPATLSLGGSKASITGTLKAWNAGTILWNSGSLAMSDLQLAGGGKMFLSSGHNKVLKVNTLSLDVANGSKLDLADNNMIVDYSTIGTLMNDLRTDLLSGALTTSFATSATRLGYGDNAILNKASFAGQAVDSTSALIKYTYAGDANLDGKVDLNDIYMFSQHWLNTGQVWTSGDFNYDGTVDARDLGLLAINWQAGVNGGALGAPIDDAFNFVGLPPVSAPEPAGMICVASAASLLLRRQRQFVEVSVN